MLTRAPKILKDKFDGDLYYLHEIRENLSSCPDLIYKYFYEGYSYKSILHASEIEQEFEIVDRKVPKAVIEKQGQYECLLASFAMLTGIDLKTVRKEFKKIGWKHTPKGANDDHVHAVAKNLGLKLVRFHHFLDLPCIVTLKSINFENVLHAVYWDGKEILDPNYNVPGREYYSPQWTPTTIGASSFMYLAEDLHDVEAIEREYKEYDKNKMEALKKGIITKLKERFKESL